MSLTNFQDLSVLGSNTGAGFQFEFYCAHCTRRWKSPFRPYRMGQINGILSHLAYFLDSARDASHRIAKVGEIRGNGAHTKALEEAQEMAQRLYSVCTSCTKACCEECFDSREQCCVPCLDGAGNSASSGGSGGSASNGGSSARGGAGPACPNCGTGNGGGRFCAECGFDMASTHKSCPGCGAMSERGARFCGDCGHGF